MSKITDLAQFYAQQAYIGKTPPKASPENAEKPTPEVPPTHQTEDTVSISKRSRNMLIAMKAAESLPDEEDWENKVEQLHNDVKEGRYQVDPGKVADKMLGNVVDKFA